MQTLLDSATKRRKMADNSFRHGGMIENPPLHGGDGVDVDVINQLPQPLLTSIISLLPTKQAVATSAVCRNWRDLWRYLNRIDITVTRTSGDIEHVMDSQMNKVIDRCKIEISENTGGLVDYVSWLESLRDRKGLQELQMVFKGDANPNVPTGFYRNLRVVEINNNKYYLAGEAFMWCDNLKTLKLTNVVLSDETLAQIVAHCPRLETLSLVSCKGLKDFMIIKDGCKSLKCLEIDGLRVRKFGFCLMKLRVLCLANFSCKSHYIQCPNLSVLQTSNNNPDILSRFSGLLGANVLDYCSLRELKCCLNLDEWYDLILLRFILRSPTLHHLHINNEVYKESDNYMHQSLPYPWVDFWKGEITELKVVHIRGFQGRDKEMQLVSYLIKDAEALKKLVIEFDPVKPSIKENSKKELASLERASADASIVFNDLTVS